MGNINNANDSVALREVDVQHCAAHSYLQSEGEKMLKVHFNLDTGRWVEQYGGAFYHKYQSCIAGGKVLF